MKTQTDSLRLELAQLAEAQRQHDPTRPPTFPKDLIERVVHHVRQQARRGQTLLQCSQELGLPRARLHYWVYQLAKPKVCSPPGSLLRPVQLSAQIVPVPDGVPERRYTLRSPSGWQLGDLRLPELIELLRSLP